MRKLFKIVFFLGLLGVVVGLYLTHPNRIDPSIVAAKTANVENGAEIFNASGCASCHAVPGSAPEDRLVLAGGTEFASDFGTFFAPNISPSDAGIGGWTAVDLLNAIRHGTSPNGQHYYPAFPYGAYKNMTTQDGVDLHAYLETLPASDIASKPHDVGFPFNVRRGLGLWKIVFNRDGWVLENPGSPEIERGRYLVEAMAHCGECHTPRGILGQLDKSRWMHGAANPSGKGKIPGIAPGILDWVEDDIAFYLESGFTPDFDSAGGKMAEVIENTATMSAADRAAIAAYLKAIPAAVEN